MRAFLLVAFLVSSTARADDVPVKLHVVREQSWCGGIAPPRSWSSRAVFASVQVELRPGDRVSNEAPVTRLVADRRGVVRIALAPGRWCVSEQGARAKPGTKTPKGASRACWRRWTTTCDAVLDVKPGRSLEATVEFVHGCSFNRPCFPPRPGPP